MDVDQFLALIQSSEETDQLQAMAMLEDELVEEERVDDALDPDSLDELNDYLFDFKSILSICAQYGKLFLFQYLVEKGFIRNRDERSALYSAVLNSDPAIEQYLIEHPLDSDQLSPLHLAAARGDDQSVTEQLAQNPELIFYLDCRQYSPLFYAALKGHQSIVEKMVTHPSFQWSPVQQNSYYLGTALYAFHEAVRLSDLEEPQIEQEMLAYFKALRFYELVDQREI